MIKDFEKVVKLLKLKPLEEVENPGGAGDYESILYDGDERLRGGSMITRSTRKLLDNAAKTIEPQLKLFGSGVGPTDHSNLQDSD